MDTKVGLALGGGGARGMAHLGVIEVLENNNIPIDCIYGTSIGAILGAMYAQNPNIYEVMDIIDNYFKDKEYEDLGLENVVPKQDNDPTIFHQFAEAVGKRIVLNFAVSKSSILQKGSLKNAISTFLDSGNIQDTEIPFCAVATDLNHGNPVIYDSGDIQKAVTSSSSIPVYFAPDKENDKLVTDGGVTSQVPVREIQDTDVDVVIGVSVSNKKFDPLDQPKLLDIMSRAQEIKGAYLSKEQLKKADVGLEPNIEHGHWSEFLRYKEFIEIGKKEANQNLQKIKKVIKEKNSFLGKFINIFKRK